MAHNIIVLFKNPIEGKVKTRLGATIGDEKALMVYLELLEHTFKVARSVAGAQIHLFFSDFIDTRLQHIGSEDGLYLQSKGTLGQKMIHAFETVHDSGDKTIIIGSDCPGLTPEIIEQAFSSLAHFSIVLGPANDGGYYLLGLNEPDEGLFEGIRWSTDQVMKQTYQKAIQSGKSVKLLIALSDVDTEDDLHLLDQYI
jgi:rSAM/selenodomain-associated transferase 1